MMPGAWLADDLDVAAQVAVPFLDNIRVLGHRHHLVGLADHVQQRDLRRGQRGEVIDRVAVVRQRLGLGQAVRLETSLPFPLVAAPAAVTGRPALEIADRVVDIDTGHLVRVPRRPAEHQQTAPAHPFQDRAIGEQMFKPQVLVQFVPERDRGRRPERVADIGIDQVITPCEQREIDLRFVSPELGPPDPRFAVGYRLRHHHPATTTGQLEIVLVVTVKPAVPAGKDRCGRDRVTGKFFAHSMLHDCHASHEKYHANQVHSTPFHRIGSSLLRRGLKNGRADRHPHRHRRAWVRTRCSWMRMRMAAWTSAVAGSVTRLVVSSGSPTWSNNPYG